jgi:hypothetical protein
MDMKDSQIVTTLKDNIVEQFTVAGFNQNYYYPRESGLRLPQKSWLA